MESKRGLNEMKNLKGKKKMKDHDFKNPRESWSNLISLGLKRKGGGEGGGMGRLSFYYHLFLCASHLSASTLNWSASEPQLVLLSLPLVLMCFALKRKWLKK